MTWALDLGTTNTAVARWDDSRARPSLVELPGVCRKPDRDDPLEAPRLVPSAVHLVERPGLLDRLGSWGPVSRSLFLGRRARLVCPVILPALLGSVYVDILVVHMPGAPGGFGSLQELRRFFDRPELLLGGWVHYLAFDLFVGSWEVRDAARHGVRHAWVVPCLVLTLLFGPAGLLAYLGLRAAVLRTVAID